MSAQHHEEDGLEPVRIAVIGAGRWGPNHVRNFNSLPDAHVTVVVDNDGGRAARIREMFREVRVESNHRSVLDSPDVDALVVATPTSTHHAIVRDALAAGKHVLCEKPLCDRGDLAADLAAMAQSSGTILMVGHVFLFNAGIIKLKEIVDSGQLGRIQYFTAVRTNLGPIRQDVNAALDLASHDISIFNWLLGATPEAASATGGAFLQPGIEDVVSISLRYPGGTFASIHASWLNPKKVRQITAVGTKRMVTWDDLELSVPIAIYDAGAEAKQEFADYGEFLRVSTWDNEIRLPKVGSVEPLRAQARAFIDAIRSGEVARSDAAFGLGVVRTLDAVTGSLHQDGRFVAVSK
jgi:predicted dehydrogenase